MPAPNAISCGKPGKIVGTPCAVQPFCLSWMIPGDPAQRAAATPVHGALSRRLRDLRGETRKRPAPRSKERPA